MYLVYSIIVVADNETVIVLAERCHEESSQYYSIIQVSRIQMEFLLNYFFELILFCI